MKSVILAAVVALSTPAFAGPVEVVKQAFGKVADVMKNGNEAQQIRTMCSMVDTYVNVDYVTNLVLGKYAKSGEARALKDFKDLVPGIIVTDFMVVAPYFKKYPMEVSGETVARGGGSRGVLMNLIVSEASNNILKMVVVTTPIGGRTYITDFEVKSYNTRMVDAKRKAYGKIMSEGGSTPVGHLVDELRKDRDLIHCR